MIVSRARRYVFVHIPKTGGTSLALALEGRAAKDDILIGDTPKARRRRKRQQRLAAGGRLRKHSGLTDLDGLLTAPELAEMFVFTVVRNPWDRMVSYYHWLKRQRFDHPAVRLAARLDFSAFLAHPQTAESFRAAPCRSYVTDAAGVERCDLFLRFEDMAPGLAEIEARLGLRLGPLPHVNRSLRRRDWRSYYSDADARRLAGICARDIADFGYRFD